jgi:hypothetical protein
MINFIKYKEFSLEVNMSHLNSIHFNNLYNTNVLFESLYSFIKFSENYLGNGRGVSKSDIRMSYAMLYRNFPLLRSPGQTGKQTIIIIILFC